MKLCNRCPVTGCLLNYLGPACVAARNKVDPECVPNRGDLMRDADNAEMANILLQADFCECCDHVEQTGTCSFLTEHPDQPLYNGCIVAAKRWLDTPVKGR